MLYHLALMAGLEIMERHNHSIDIYKESERYTPLGADATVVYGYKDLRIINNRILPIQFKFDVSKTTFVGKLCSPQLIEAKQVIFERTVLMDKTIVTTQEKRHLENIRLTQSTYSKG